MEDNGKKKFSIYKIAKSNLYAAIPAEFLRIIRQYATEYKDLGLVPSDKEVEGIVLNTIPARNCNFSNQYAQIIPINKLSFGDDF